MGKTIKERNMFKIQIFTIDPDLDGFENLEKLTYNDVMEMGEHQSSSSDYRTALETLVFLFNEESINTETFIVVVDTEAKELISHQKF